MTRSGENMDGRLPEDEDALLLPWLETGRLDRPERDRLNQRLGADEAFAAEARSIGVEAFAATSANEALDSPSPAVLDRLMASIEHERQPRSVRARLSEFLRGFAGATRFDGGFVRLAGAAAAIVIVVQAAMIGALVMETGQQASQTYETASGERGAVGAHLVTFVDDADLAAVAAVLAESRARMEGPLPGGFYRITLNDAEPRQVSVVERLKQAGLITLALPAQ